MTQWHTRTRSFGCSKNESRDCSRTERMIVRACEFGWNWIACAPHIRPLLYRASIDDEQFSSVAERFTLHIALFLWKFRSFCSVSIFLFLILPSSASPVSMCWSAAYSMPMRVRVVSSVMLDCYKQPCGRLLNVNTYICFSVQSIILWQNDISATEKETSCRTNRHSDCHFRAAVCPSKARVNTDGCRSSTVCWLRLRLGWV